jgi:hypothetical protein
VGVEIVKIVAVGDKHYNDTNDIGDVHIRVVEMYEFETICGISASGDKYEDTHEPVTCGACEEIYRSIKSNRKRVVFGSKNN